MSCRGLGWVSEFVWNPGLKPWASFWLCRDELDCGLSRPRWLGFELPRVCWVSEFMKPRAEALGFVFCWLGQDVLDYVAVDVCQTEVAAVEVICQLLVIQT